MCKLHITDCIVCESNLNNEIYEIKHLLSLHSVRPEIAFNTIQCTVHYTNKNQQQKTKYYNVQRTRRLTKHFRKQTAYN